MISVEQALANVLALMRPVGLTPVPLARAGGRVLAQDAVARRAQPPFDAAAMDGYAARAADLAHGVPGPATLQVIGTSAAGHRFSGALGPGQAVRIFTGAPVPPGADCIVIQEDTEPAEADSIRVRPGCDSGHAPGHHIRPAGADFAVGSTLAAPRRLSSADIALLAAMNIARVQVYRRPRIALIATGDELVKPGQTPGPDQIISSNNYGLKALVEALGARALLLPIARDTLDSLRGVLAMARGADLIVTLGGASVGDHDIMAQIASDDGFSRSFYKVAMRPGKPLMAGRLHGVPLIGLPGNPVSAMVCGHVFLRPAIAALSGLPATEVPRSTARLATPLPANGPREHYMRAQMGPDGVRAQARQDSALLSVLAASNALLVRPPHDPPRAAGEMAQVINLSCQPAY